MTDITGGDLLLELLEGYGVEYIFCSPGTEWAPVWEALAARKTQGRHAPAYVNCRHEMLAVSAAMGYGECTGKMPAVLLHSGIGALHGSMALRNAYFAKAPMIVLSGETYEHRGDEEVDPQGGHWLGLLSDVGGPSSFVGGYVKWSCSIKSRDSMVDLVSRGCRIARAVPQGPVFLSVPLEVLIRSYEYCGTPVACDAPVMYGPHPACLEEAAARLAAAESPMIISEYAGKTPGAVEGLVRLSGALSIPVCEGSYSFASNFPRNNPLYMGFESADALREADVILVVGGCSPWYPPHGCSSDVFVIVLDDDPLHGNLPHWGYTPSLILTAPIAEGLEALLLAVRAKAVGQEEVGRGRLERWQARHAQWATRTEDEASSEKDVTPISPRWFFHEARRVLPDSAMILNETITHMRFVHQYVSEPGHYIKAGYGCLGVGVGESIGVKIAYPERPVILFVGDGGFNYNPVLAGLGLCQEYRVPIMIIVMNNGGYMGMKRATEHLYPQGHAVKNGVYPGVPIDPVPDYAMLSRAFGGYGERIERAGEIEAALRRGLKELDAGKTVILDVICS